MKKNIHSPKTKGFALVVTISFMILLTLIAVGLLSLSSISLRVSSQGQAVAEARSNARIALMIAIGQLQKHAGSDQRITATADLAGSANGLPLPAGATPSNLISHAGIPNGLSRMVPGTRHWTGVWRNSTNNPNEIYRRTPSATHIAWLVSGNEAATATPTYTPAFAGVTVSAAGEVSDPKTSVVLVGPGSVGNANADNYVAAPSVMINTARGTALAGRYAWWIGDEGVKARFNVPDSRTNNTIQPVAHRGSWEINGGMANYPTPGSATHPSLNRIPSLSSGVLLDPGLRRSVGAPTAMFHTATTESMGVLSDALQGGLRIDLTSCMENGLPAEGASTFPNRPATGRRILHSSIDRSFISLRGPNWDTLREFQTAANLVHQQGKLIVTGGNITIAPIVIDIRIALGARLVKVKDTRCKLNPCAKAVIALANPYPYPLEWQQDLEFEMIDETPYTNGNDTSVYAPGLVRNARFLGRKGRNEPAALNNAVFVIPRGIIPPGEARVYTQSAAIRRPINDMNVARIPMAPSSAGSSMSNFEICVELDTDPADAGLLDFASARQLDVRESWTTSQPTLELRIAGGGGSGGNILRRIERFEWDNAFHAATKLRINHEGVASSINSVVKMPFPLKIYNSQMSMPGMDYDRQGLPEAGMMGTRCSTLRTFTDFNVRAVTFPKLITSYNPPPYFFDQSDNAITDIPPTPIGSSIPSQTGLAFTQNLAFNPLPWGHSLKTSQTTSTQLFSFPRQFVSLAQLQHVDLTADDTAVSISQQPGNAVGNSYASPFVKRGLAVQLRANHIISGLQSMNPGSSATEVPSNYYDMSYLLNAALWDTYFFSTYSTSSSSFANLANPAMTIAVPPSDTNRLRDPILASSHFLLSGSFNIHSTHKDAWKAIFASTRFAQHPAGGDASGAMFPRSMEQRTPAAANVTGNGPDSFSGFRRLTPLQIDALAEQMVRQVRQRGPFVSLSHFVNRSLIDLNPAQPSRNALSRSGPLQAAIDNSGINISPDGNTNAFRNTQVTNDRLNLHVDGTGPRGDVLYPAIAGFPGNQANGSRGSFYGGAESDGSLVWAPRSADLNPGACASIYADRPIVADATLRQEQGFRSTGIPGWLTQADVLQALGPVISVRSDTFQIRAYGEAISADGSKVLAKVWCEATVQRFPNYVDPSNSAEQRNVNASTGPLTSANRAFGRRFEITSFRWLNSNEI